MVFLVTGIDALAGNSFRLLHFETILSYDISTYDDGSGLSEKGDE